MAREHMLHTELSVDECKDRLKAAAETGTFFPELRGKPVIGGVKKNRFWLQHAQSNVHRGEIWLPVLYGRLAEDATGTRITVHSALAGSARAMLVCGIGLSATLVAGAVTSPNFQLSIKSALWLVGITVCCAFWIRALRQENRNARQGLLSFVKKTLEAKPVETESLVRH